MVHKNKEMKRNYNVFLDDDRVPTDCVYYSTIFMPQDKSIYTREHWEIVRSYTDFVKLITDRLTKSEFPAIVSFDHDLADEHYSPITKIGQSYPTEFVEKTGHEAAKWLVEQCITENLELPVCWVHSMNSIGAKRIRQALDDWYKYKEKFPDQSE